MSPQGYSQWSTCASHSHPRVECTDSISSANAVYELFSHFGYVGGFGDLGDPVVSTLTGVSGDVVTVYAN